MSNVRLWEPELNQLSLPIIRFWRIRNVIHQGEDAKLADRGLGVFVEQANSSLSRGAFALNCNTQRKPSVPGANGFHHE